MGGGRGHAPAVPSLTAAGEVTGCGSEDPAAAVGHERGGGGKKWELRVHRVAAELLYVKSADASRTVDL
jgi:hypothetical protein